MVLPDRLNILLADRGREVVFAVVLVGLVLLAGAGYVYATPPTRTVSETTNQQNVATTAQTSAIVTGNTTLYEQGERLSNMPVYLFRATPNLTVTVRTTTPQGQTARVVHDLTLVMEATREGESFYSEERPLIAQEHRTSTGTTVDATTINVTELRGEASALRQEIGDAGAFSTRLRLVVEYQTDRYDGELTATTPIQFSQGSYLLGGQLSASESRSQSVSRTVTDPPNVTLAGTLGALGLVAILSALGVERHRRGIDVEDLRTAREHARYEEWISSGEFPTGADNRFTSIDALEDLVDLAIDSEKRVIYDPDLDAYAVIDGIVVYYFTTDEESIDPWLDA